jgi:hypothetical protein
LLLLHSECTQEFGRFFSRPSRHDGYTRITNSYISWLLILFLFNLTQLRKISEIDKHIGMVYSGMGPDSRVLVTKARKIAQRYMLTYGEPIPTNQLVREIASVMQEFTQSGGVRPFGVSLIVIGSDDKGPTMYQVCLVRSFMHTARLSA